MLKLFKFLKIYCLLKVNLKENLFNYCIAQILMISVFDIACGSNLETFNQNSLDNNST